MANWKETLDVSDLIEAFENGKKTIEQIAEAGFERCKKLSCYSDPEFKAIISDLSNIDDEDDYDDIMDAIYDYGDVGNRLWVKIIF